MKWNDPLRSTAIVLDEDNIDTDAIFPARFLLLLEKENIGQYLFYDRRYDGQKNERPDFVLNQPQPDSAQIFISGQNFGCGSSREHAVWTLYDYGFRCIIAPSFGEIFYANCIKNMMLPIVITKDQIETLKNLANDGQEIIVNIVSRRLQSQGQDWAFSIDDDDAANLQNGWDEIDFILETHGKDIDNFESRYYQPRNWLLASRAELTETDPKE